MSETELEQFENEAEAQEMGEDGTADLPDEIETEETIVLEDGEGEDTGEGEEPESAAEPGMAESRYLSEKEIEKRITRIGSENDRHRKRLSEILEDDALDLIQCPVCMDLFHGWVYPPDKMPLTDEQRERMLQLLGMDEWEEIPEASWANVCPDCRGHGKVKTGSRVQNREVTGCLRCGESGWINTGRQNAANGDVDIPEAVMTGPTVFAGNEPDPRVNGLRSEGYTVIPPMPAVAQ